MITLGLLKVDYTYFIKIYLILLAAQPQHFVGKSKTIDLHQSSFLQLERAGKCLMPGYMPELTKHPRSESSNGFLLLLAYAVPCGSLPLKLKSFSNYAGQRSFHSLSRRVGSSLHGFKFLVFQKTIGSSIGLALSSSYCLGIRPRCQS